MHGKLDVVVVVVEKYVAVNIYAVVVKYVAVVVVVR